MRRTDGQPWKHEPSQEGDYNYYSPSPPGTSDGELTEDCMIFICVNDYDLLSCVLSQYDGKPVPQPGEVIPMQAKFQDGIWVFVDAGDKLLEDIYAKFVAAPGVWLTEAMTAWRQARSTSD